MTLDVKEKFAPNSYISSTNNVTNIVLEYDLSGYGYFRIAEEGAFLYSGELNPTTKKYDLVKEASLKRGDLLRLKASSDQGIFYVLVLSGEEKLSQGWVRGVDIVDAKASSIPPAIVTGKLGHKKYLGRC